MLQLRCPQCKRMLRFEDSDRGETVACVSCQHRFVVPRPEHEDLYDMGDEETTYGIDPEPEPLREDLRPSKLQTPRHGSFEDENDPRGPRRPRGRRHEKTDSQNFFSVWRLEIAILMAIGGVYVVLLGLAFIFPPLAIGLLGVGLVMSVTARIWALVAAFNEDASTGCTTFIFPWYGFWGLEDRKPLYLFIMGFFFVASGALVLATRFHGN